MYFDLGSFSIFADSDYVQIIYDDRIFVHGLEIKPESGVYGKAAAPARCPHLSCPGESMSITAAAHRDRDPRLNAPYVS